MGVQERLEGFRHGCADNLGRQFVPKRDSLNAESVLVTAGTTSLFVELIVVAT